MALKTQGTELYILDPDDTGNEVIKVTKIMGGSGVGGEAGEIPATNLDSLALEFLTGLKDNGSITLNINYTPSEASHQKLNELFGGDNVRFLICGSESNTQPSYSASTYTIPTDRTTWDFEAGVRGFSKDFESDNIWKATATLRVSGEVVETPAS